MTNLWNSIQAPQTTLGKNVRDAIIVGLAGGAVVLLQSIDGIDFGQYNAIVTAIVAFGVAALNRLTRK